MVNDYYHSEFPKIVFQEYSRKCDIISHGLVTSVNSPVSVYCRRNYSQPKLTPETSCSQVVAFECDLSCSRWFILDEY